MWNSLLCFCLLLASWRSCSAFYLPQMEVDRPNGELKPMLTKLMDDVQKIIDVVETNNNNEQFVNLETLNSRLAQMQYTTIDNIKQMAFKQSDIINSWQLRIEKLQSKLSANVAAVEDLKDQLAKLVAAQDEQSHLAHESDPEPEKDEDTLDEDNVEDKEGEDDESKSNSAENGELKWLFDEERESFYLGRSPKNLKRAGFIDMIDVGDIDDE